MKNKTRFIPGFLLGMFAMLVVVAGIGVGIYFSDMGINTSDETMATDKAEKKLKVLENEVRMKMIDFKLIKEQELTKEEKNKTR